MTAINPARLKIQCAALSEYYSNPAKFIPGLHDLLGFYAGRIRQTSLAHSPLSLQTYQVPAPVLRELVSELEGSLKDNPGLGLKLIDALWEEEWVEFRQLAIICLGDMPPFNPQQILERIKSWLESCTTEDIRLMIMTRGLIHLAEEKPKIIFNFIQDLISSGSKINHQAALFGLITFGNDPDFDNLPLIYNLLAEILQNEETGLIKEITSLLKVLQKRSEQETAYFLERQLAAAAKPRIFRVTRQVMRLFNSDNRVMLRKALENFT
jgi:hypothetical protein